MEGAGADFHVVGLQDDAALVGPIALQRQDQALERALRAHMGGNVGHAGFESVAEGEDPIRRIISGSSRARPDALVVGRAGPLSTDWNRTSFLQLIAVQKYLSGAMNPNIGSGYQPDRGPGGQVGSFP